MNSSKSKSEQDKEKTGPSPAKKAKLQEVESKEAHKEAKEEMSDDAMEMDMGDSDVEEFVSKDELGEMDPAALAQMEEDRKMMEAMGFPTGFGSTKGKHVEGNNIYVSYKIKVRKVRQLIHNKGRPKAGGRAPTPKQ